MGFFAMLLGNILFLTSVWHYSILKAGLAVTPGPLVVAAVSGPAGRMAARVRVPAGAARPGSWSSWPAWPGTPPGSGSEPDYLGVWLPATLITGLGIGLTFPVLSAAAVSSLHPERFAVGSAVNQTARQVGGAFGVALLVVILGTPTGPVAALASFHHLWWYCAGTAALAGLLCTLLRPAAGPAGAGLEAGRSDPADVARTAGRGGGRRGVPDGLVSGPAGPPRGGRPCLPSPSR